MNSSSPRRLAAAHATLSLLTLVAAIAVWWLPVGAADAPVSLSLRRAIVWFEAATIIYLLLTLLNEAWLAWHLRRSSAVTPPPIALPAGHLWVLLVAGAALARGPASRTMLAGGDGWIAVLLSVSGPALLLSLATWWLSRNLSGTNGLPAPLKGKWLAWITCAAGLLVVAALWYLETRSL